jgi:hypothetical protein
MGLHMFTVLGRCPLSYAIHVPYSGDDISEARLALDYAEFDGYTELRLI